MSKYRFAAWSSVLRLEGCKTLKEEHQVTLTELFIILVCQSKILWLLRLDKPGLGRRHNPMPLNFIGQPGSVLMLAHGMSREPGGYGSTQHVWQADWPNTAAGSPSSQTRPQGER